MDLFLNALQMERASETRILAGSKNSKQRTALQKTWLHGVATGRSMSSKQTLQMVSQETLVPTGISTLLCKVSKKHNRSPQTHPLERCRSGTVLLKSINDREALHIGNESPLTFLQVGCDAARVSKQSVASYRHTNILEIPVLLVQGQERMVTALAQAQELLENEHVAILCLATQKVPHPNARGLSKRRNVSY
jgi:hypothetical protein